MLRMHFGVLSLFRYGFVTDAQAYNMHMSVYCRAVLIRLCSFALDSDLRLRTKTLE